MPLEVPPLDLEFPTYEDVRRALRENGIKIEEDEENLGHISFFFGGGFACFWGRPLLQGYCPLFYYKNYGDPETASTDLDLENRKPFDSKYLEARRHLVDLYGDPIEEGRHQYGHRPPTHYYLYAVWQLKHCRLALAQIEYEIQYGLELDLWFLYKDGPAERLIYEFGYSSE